MKRKKRPDQKTEYAKERTQLAHERTFLAWLRTGLACVAGGVVVIRFLFFQSVTHQLIAKLAGLFLILCGIFIFCLTLLDYQRSRKALHTATGYTGSIWSVASIVAILVIISLALCFIV